MSQTGLVTRMNLLPALALVAVTITAFFRIPGDMSIPIHWDFEGMPDAFWTRDAAFMVAPICAAILLAGAWLLGRFVPKAQLDVGRHVLEWSLTGILAILAVIQVGLLLIGIGSDIDIIRLLAGALAIFFFVLGNELRRVTPQPFAGLRLPWTLKDARNWKLSHAMTGILMMLAALGLAVATWLFPDPRSLIATILAAALAPPLIGALYSFVLSLLPRSS